MISLSDITSFDVIVVVLFLLFMIRGAWIGFMRQLSFFLALILSYLIAGQYTGRLMPFVGNFIENPKFVFFISFLLLFLVGTVLLILLGKLLSLVVQLTLAGWFDKVLGFALGVFKGILVASFLYMIMSSGPSSAHDLVQKSFTSRYLAEGAAMIHQLINDVELRERFLPKAPAIPAENKPEGDSPEPGKVDTRPTEKSFIDSHFFKDAVK